MEKFDLKYVVNGEKGIEFVNEKVEEFITIINGITLENTRKNKTNLTKAMTLEGDTFFMCENCANYKNYCIYTKRQFSNWDGRCDFQSNGRLDDIKDIENLKDAFSRGLVGVKVYSLEDRLSFLKMFNEDIDYWEKRLDLHKNTPFMIFCMYEGSVEQGYDTFEDLAYIVDFDNFKKEYK